VLLFVCDNLINISGGRQVQIIKFGLCGRPTVHFTHQNWTLSGWQETGLCAQHHKITNIFLPHHKILPFTPRSSK
jgi:hypothetical protein